MEPLVTAEQMRRCDRIAIRKLGVPGTVLMENAGRAVSIAVEQHLGNVRNKTVFLFCGTGNNGGDGFVAARHLTSRGARSVILLVGSAAKVKGDAKIHLQIVRNIIKGVNNPPLQCVELKSLRSLDRLGKPDVIVDALFGTGFKGAVRKPYQEVIEWINASAVPVVAVDVPSGLDADNGKVENVAVRATITVTMGLRKTGLVVGQGHEHAGIVEIERIGIPQQAFQQETRGTYLVSMEDIRRTLPRRPFNAHKHSVGKIFVLAGSPGLTGAATMVSRSAMRAGAGAVVLGTPKSVYSILAKKLTEVMVEPLDDTDDGTVSLRAYPAIKKFVDWSDVVIVGPGSSRQPETQHLLRKMVDETDKHLVVDADALNAISSNTSMLKRRRNNKIILTPHTGEFSRLTGVPSVEIEDQRIEIARSFALKLGVTTVLKGAPTVTASSEGVVFVNSTGNPGMATAGSGDVLGGIITTLWAQGLRSAEAAFCGVYIHGLAGDLAKSVYGERGLMAMDILAKINDAIRLIDKAAGETR